jgi:hypothetical protein
MGKQLLLQLVTLLLYAGPLVAGLADYGWSVVPAFVLIFLLWQIMMRPADWPRTAAQWREPGEITGAFTRLALIVILVGVCLGIGRGLGGAVGFVSGVPLYAPLAVSFLAIPLARLVRDPMAGALRDDRLVAQPTVLAVPTEDTQGLREAIRPLLDLPSTTSDATAQGAVARLGDSPMSAALLRTLREALTFHNTTAPAARRGLILWSTEPAVADRFEGAEVLAEAWSAAKGWPDLQRIYAERGLTLIRAEPSLAADFPPVADLKEAATIARDPAGASAMLALADALVTAQGQGRASANA